MVEPQPKSGLCDFDHWAADRAYFYSVIYDCAGNCPHWQDDRGTASGSAGTVLCMGTELAGFVADTRGCFPEHQY